MSRYGYYYVLSTRAAIQVGIIDDKWEEIVPHEANEEAVKAVAQTRHRSLAEAEHFAVSSGDDAWVLGPDGRARWVPN